MEILSENCFVCGEEFPTDELHQVAISAFTITKYKICPKCIKKSDPKNDYAEVKDIIESFNNKDLE